jgi:hypothetical protein
VLGDTDGRDRVEKILQEQKAYTRALLGENQHLVAALRDALVTRHELIGREITDILEEASAAHRGETIDVRDSVLGHSGATVVSTSTPLPDDLG